MNFVDQEMNFRIVKKTSGIYGKIENNEWWGQKVNFGQKKRTVRGTDFRRRCIIYSKYCRTGPTTLSQLRVFFIGNPWLSLADLTLPLVNPPTSQGQPNYFLPSTRTKDAPSQEPPTKDHAGCVSTEDRRVQSSDQDGRTILIRPLDTSSCWNDNPTSGQIKTNPTYEYIKV